MMDFTKLKKLSIGGVELKQLFINGVQVWKSGPKNLVPTSTDTDGSIYNGVGYKEKLRINSSGNVVAYDYCTLTGLMPCDGLNDSSRIYVKGLSYADPNYYNGFAMYDENRSLMGSFRYYAAKNEVSAYNNNVVGFYHITGSTVTIRDDGVTVFKINMNEGNENHDKVKYFRLYGQPTGEEIIATFNEDIT